MTLLDFAVLGKVALSSLVVDLCVARNEMCLPDSIEDWEETEANFGRMGSGVAGGGCLWWPIGEMPKQSEVEAK